MSRGVEQGVKLGVEDFAIDRYRCRASVEVQKHQTQEIRLDRSIKCREAIEGTGTFSIDPSSYRGSVEIVIRKELKSSTDSQVSRRYRGGVEIA